MRCRNCDYALWNLKTRSCPECGESFRPDQFEFTPNAVRYCCPECDQAYYGTDATGHLKPAEFECVSCGAQLRMNDMVLRPAAGVSEAQAAAEFMPWLERRRIGTLRAWLLTIGRSMSAPVRLIRAVPPTDSTGSAWRYALVTIAIMLFGGFGLSFGTIGTIAMFRNSDPLEDFLVVLGFIFIPPAVVLVGLALWGLVTHGLLRGTGGARYSIGRTFQALCFSSGAMAPTVIPCLGVLLSVVGLTWWVVSGIVMVAEGQSVRVGRAAFATLVFPVVALLTVVVAYFGFTIFAMNMAQSVATARAQAVSAAQNTFGGAVYDIVDSYRDDHGRAFPVHAIELVEGQYGGAYDFILDDSATHDWDVIIGSETLETFNELGQEEQRAQVRKVLDSMPSDIIAHRMGDVVFTWHGIDPVAADVELWMLIVSPDPDVNPTVGTRDQLAVVRLDGTTAQYSNQEFRDSLHRQNILREEHGLAHLPHPRDVTHGEPATSAETE